jgi:hypothetical protein
MVKMLGCLKPYFMLGNCGKTGMPGNLKLQVTVKGGDVGKKRKWSTDVDV